MSKLQKFQNGDEVFLSAVYLTDNGGNEDGAPVTVKCWVHEATVLMADRNLIDLGANGTPRGVGYGEQAHGSPKAAWLRCADECRRAAAILLAEAEECGKRAMYARGSVAPQQEVA